MLLVAVISLLAALSPTLAQEIEECDREGFVLGLGLPCALNFLAANSTPTTEAGMQALDVICTAECAGATAAYLAAPPCNNTLEAFGLGIWCCPVENAAISRCRYALPELLDPTILLNAGACAAFAVDPSTCPANCSSALTDLSEEIGCCFQKLFNVSAEEIQLAGIIDQNAANLIMLLSMDPLWNVCDVPIPGDCTGEPFPVTPTMATTEGAVRIAATVTAIMIGTIISFTF